MNSTTQPLSAHGSDYTANANGLDVQLDSSGLRASAAGLDWSMNFSGIGRGSQIKAVPATKPHRDGSNLEYDHENITEWYKNTAMGLEQGFTLASAPQGNGDVVLQISVTTSLNGVLDKNGLGLSFAAGKGQTLRYDHLLVTDANGKPVEAHLTYTSKQILINIHDQNAVYPLTVDPLLYLETEVISSDGVAYDDLGWSIAISGNTAVVGAYDKTVNANTAQGEAYVFVRLGSTWSQQAVLTSSDGTAHDAFGYSVAISGDTAVVGAYYKTVDGNAIQGEAYVFVRSYGTWSQQATLTSSDGAADDAFGYSVAIDGDAVVVGAYNKTVNGNIGPGEAYVFVRSSGVWSQQATLTSSGGAAGDKFGYSVAISGDTIIVGAPDYTVNSNVQQGTAFVFVEPVSGWTTGTPTTQLISSDGAAGDFFGYSVAISGDTAVVGAYGKNDGGGIDQGKAYVFVKPVNGWAWEWLTGWTETAQLTSSNIAAADLFGNSVAISNDTIVVGAFNKTIGYNDSQGEAYVFVKPVNGWTSGTETTHLISSDGAAGDQFGSSVAISGDMIAVGASAKTVGSNVRQGSAYFYYPYRTDQDLAVGAAVSSASPLPNQTVTFTASVTNWGPSSAMTVLLSAPLPNGFSYVSSAATYGGTYDSSTGSWDVGSLAMGITATLTIQATVDSTAAGTYPTFTASLLSSDTNAANNSASVDLHVPLLAFSLDPLDFGSQLVKTASPVQTVTVTNLSEENVTLGVLKSSSTAFVVGNNTCKNNLVLDTYSTCTFTLQFKPTATIAYTGSITLPNLIPTDTTALAVTGYGARPTQLLANRSFQIDANKDKVPDLWISAGTWSSADGRDCTTHFAGSCSLKFTGDGNLKQLTFTAARNGSSGDSYAFSVWTRGASVPAGATLDAKVNFFDGATLVSTQTIPIPAGTYAFKAFKLAFSAGATYTTVQVVLEYNGVSGSAWFDNASLIWTP